MWAVFAFPRAVDDRVAGTGADAINVRMREDGADNTRILQSQMIVL
jgi:hypothetical protein